MSKLNVYIDGSWLFKACAPRGVLAAHMEYSDQAVLIDFAQLDMILLDHAKAHDPDCTELGERYIGMSIFTLPFDFTGWPAQHGGINRDHVEQTKRVVFARNRFINSTTDAGYRYCSVGRQLLTPWILRLLIDDNQHYHEKEVDGTLIALLVEAATETPSDQQCVITGDADFLAAVRATRRERDRNVILATTRPDEAKAEHRQSSFALNNFGFRIPPIYLQDNLLEIVRGSYASECCQCRRVFSRSYPIPNYLPRCGPCYDDKIHNRRPYRDCGV